MTNPSSKTPRAILTAKLREAKTELLNTRKALADAEDTVADLGLESDLRSLYSAIGRRDEVRDAVEELREVVADLKAGLKALA